MWTLTRFIENYKHLPWQINVIRYIMLCISILYLHIRIVLSRFSIRLVKVYIVWLQKIFVCLLLWLQKIFVCLLFMTSKDIVCLVSWNKGSRRKWWLLPSWSISTTIIYNRRFISACMVHLCFTRCLKKVWNSFCNFT
jgi:hypothetical protein